MARRDRRRKQAGALAVSLVVHAALLVVLARVVVPTMYQPPSTPTPEFQIQLVKPPPAAPVPTAAPRASRRSAVRAARTPAASRTPAPQRSPAPPARAIQARPRPAPPNAPAAPPSPPSHATASVPAAGAANGAVAGGGNPWRVEGEDDGQDGVRKFLRATVGCSHEDYVRLTGPERANCDRRVGHDARMMGSASVDTVGPAKRGYYNAVQDAYQSLHDPRPSYDAQGNRVMPGHMPGLGCKFGGGSPPPGSIKVGPCFITPPQGVGTEESGIAPP